MKLRNIGTILLLTVAMAACGGGNGGSGKSVSIESKLKSGKPLASKGGVSIHEGYLDFVKLINPNVTRQLGSPAGKKRLVDNLLDQEILYQAAVKKGIPQIQKYQEKAALYERVIFAQGLLEEEINKKAKDYYEKNKGDEFTQVKLSHILFSTKSPRGPKAKDKKEKPDPKVLEAAAREKAEEAKKKLESGAKWEDVVAEYSDDRLSKKRGGDIGNISRTDRRAQRLDWKEMIEKAFSMKAGEVSDPIKAKDGYHIIKVVEAAKEAPFEEVKGRIEFKVRAQTKNEVLSELTKGAKIEYQDEELKKLGGPAKVKPKLPVTPK